VTSNTTGVSNTFVGDGAGDRSTTGQTIPCVATFTGNNGALDTDYLKQQASCRMGMLTQRCIGNRHCRHARALTQHGSASASTRFMHWAVQHNHGATPLGITVTQQAQHSLWHSSVRKHYTTGRSIGITHACQNADRIASAGHLNQRHVVCRGDMGPAIDMTTGSYKTSTS
jgi:hypothetical protein